MGDIVPPAQVVLANRVRTWLATHRDAEDLINIGAYRAGSNHRIDEAIARSSRSRRSCGKDSTSARHSRRAPPRSPR